MTPEESLRRAEARYQRAFRASEAARLAREEAIREAFGNGLSTRQIAAFVSVTGQRVHQIVAGHHAARRPSA